MTKNFKISVAYAHDFQNQITGPLILPFLGALPGTSVRTAATADAVQIGATVAFSLTERRSGLFSQARE